MEYKQQSYSDYLAWLKTLAEVDTKPKNTYVGIENPYPYPLILDMYEPGCSLERQIRALMESEEYMNHRL
jgi:hypothetical protein